MNASHLLEAMGNSKIIRYEFLANRSLEIFGRISEKCELNMPLQCMVGVVRQLLDEIRGI